MRRTRFQWIAAVSAILLLITAVHAARRPRYGGTLQVEVGLGLSSVDPADSPSSPAEMRLKTELLGEVFETLVRFDEHGQLQPWLATGWTHDPAHKRWVFTARSNVVLHNGSVWTVPDSTISVPDKKPIAKILRDLSQLSNAIAVPEPDGKLSGAGPFRITKWERGQMIKLEAHEEYWGGRPFLDTVEVRKIPAERQRLLDLDLAKADVVEAALTDLRQLRQKGVAVEVSKPMDALVLAFENPRIPVETRQALALAIDRPAIQRVLLDRQGEVSGALLPQWLSGYAFLFPVDRNLSRAKMLAGAGFSLTFGYDREDPLIRAIAERIAVNATEAGLTMPYASGVCDVRLRRLPLMSFDVSQALDQYASMLAIPLPQAASAYESELALLKDFRVIPLFHLPTVYALRPNVRNWTAGWRVDNVWLENGTKP